MVDNNLNTISLNKYISSTGMCSRREADKWIKEGKVRINGKVAQLGNRVGEDDKIIVNGKALKSKPKAIYIAYNKPVGIVCTTDPKEPKNIVRQIKHKQRLFPIGRLDKPSEGLIFLTNDGDIVNKILRAGNKHEKEYLVTVDIPITSDFILKMGNGIPVLGTITKKCKVRKIDDYRFSIVLTQGMNRQIRRMCEYLGSDVIKLKRTRIMNVSLGKLKIGQWRLLSPKEMNIINKMLIDSSKTGDTSAMMQKQKRKQKKQNSK